jgi:hypothetical protein
MEFQGGDKSSFSPVKAPEISETRLMRWTKGISQRGLLLKNCTSQFPRHDDDAGESINDKNMELGHLLLVDDQDSNYSPKPGPTRRRFWQNNKSP